MSIQNIIFISFILIQSVDLQNICNYKECLCSEELNTIYITCNISSKESVLNYNDKTNALFIQVDTLVIDFNSDDTSRLPNHILDNLDIYLLTIKNHTMLQIDPIYFDNTVSVKTFCLSHNNLKSINFNSYSINFKETIEFIMLNNNQLESVPNLDGLNNLNEIDLSFNRIEAINSDSINITNLETLDLSSNLLSELKSFPVAIQLSLKKLDLDGNQIDKLDYLSDLSSLNLLKLSNNRIKQIRNKTLILNELIEMDLSSNLISSIEEDSFMHLIKLTTLDLSNNKLNWLSENLFQNLYQLEKLYLQFNNLKLFNLKYLSKLFILDLSNNKLAGLQHQFGDLYEDLNILRLSNNNLTTAKFLSIFPSIQFIYLNNNYLNEIYSDISTVTKMDYSNQNGKLEIIPNYLFKKLKTSQVLLTLNLSLNSNLKFGNKSFCLTNINNRYQKSFLDIHLSNKTVTNIDRCILKRLSLIFKRVRLFILDSNELNSTDFICKCDYRLFLSYYNIIIKNKCPRYSTYCFDEEFYDDCNQKTEFNCM